MSIKHNFMEPEYEAIIGKTVTINDNPVRIPFVGKIGLLINKAKI